MIYSNIVLPADHDFLRFAVKAATRNSATPEKLYNPGIITANLSCPARNYRQIQGRDCPE
jgi:hypothetical protein